MFVVICRRLHKSKVHVEFSPTRRHALGRALSGLFADVGLLFEINEVEGVIFEHGGGPKDVLGKEFQLMFAGGTKM